MPYIILKLFQFGFISKFLPTKVAARNRSKIAAVLIVLVGFSLFLIFSQHDPFHEDASKGIDLQLLDELSGIPLIVPSYFPKKNIKTHINKLLKDTHAYTEDYKIYSMLGPKIFPEQTLLVNDFSSVFKNFKEEKTPIYGSAKDIKGKLDECRDLESELSYTISNQQDVNTPAVEIAQVFIKALENGDEYAKAIEKYFLKKIKLQLKYNVADKFWFKLAGTSVWLKEYGLHLMVSRVVYSEANRANHPTFSISYAQLFTDDWVEVTTSLLVPTNLGRKENKNAIEVDGEAYTVMSYPMAIPVPFMIDPGKDLQGPEDPRLLLVKNKRGHEEPLIIFNQDHQKKEMTKPDGTESDDIKNYRTMWISFPWQYQVGKYNVDDEDKFEYKRKLFSKTSELKIVDTRREFLVKNWTPMTSRSLREFHGYDKSLLIISRFTNLEVLECDLTSEETSCRYMSIDDNKPQMTEVGPLRGGTEMVNINDIISEQTNFPVERLIKKGREIWVGFARAHFRDCGCGRAFYRPNIVVVTLDLITGEDNKVRQVFSLSHVSSFMDLDVDIITWSDEEPNLCQGPNVLIPNGISHWKIGQIGKNEKRDAWLVDDMLTLSFSVSDITVSVLKIKGLLESLVKMSPHSPFKKYEAHIDDLLHDAEDSEDNDDILSRTREFGLSDDSITCALEDSKRFCRVYGEKHFFDKEEWKKFKETHHLEKKVDKDFEDYSKEVKEN